MKRQERLDNLETSLRLALDDRQSQMWTAIPAIVEGVDLEAQTISAQPAIKAVLTDRQGVKNDIELPLLLDVPIVWPRAGGFSLTFPIKNGDEVLIVFSSRCIDAWFQSGGISVQAEQRMHDLSDGFAILAPTSQPKKLGGVSSNSVQLRNDSGSAHVEIDSSGNVNIVSSSSINLTADDINLDCDQLDINAGTQATITTPMLTIDAQTTINGSLSSNGLDFNTHRHSGVQTGSGDTGTPIP